MIWWPFELLKFWKITMFKIWNGISCLLSWFVSVSFELLRWKWMLLLMLFVHVLHFCIIFNHNSYGLTNIVTLHFGCCHSRPVTSNVMFFTTLLSSFFCLPDCYLSLLNEKQYDNILWQTSSNLIGLHSLLVFFLTA